jgi:hypothetical protein
MHRSVAWPVALVVGSLLLTVPESGAEMLTIPPCGSNAVTTAGAYSGLVSITVSGTMVNTPGNPSTDAFYNIEELNPSVPVSQAPEWLRFAREGQAPNTCYPGAYPVSGLFAQPYPAFDAGHSYAVLLDLGPGPAARLLLGIADCGCWDNSGTFPLTIDPATTTTTTSTTTTSTTTTTIPPDADADGVLDASEPCLCVGTTSGAPVTALGCSVDQACPCAAPHGRSAWGSHGEYVRCVKYAAREMESRGVMTRDQRIATTRAAAASTCGR